MGTVLELVRGALAGIGAVAVAVVAYVVGASWYYQVYLRRGLERDLGFETGSACMPHEDAPNGYVSAVAVESVAEGGVFQQAGAREGDILPDESETSLFRTLHRHRGRMAELAVVDGGPGPIFHHRNRRVIRFAVPPRRRRPERSHGA